LANSSTISYSKETTLTTPLNDSASVVAVAHPVPVYAGKDAAVEQVFKSFLRAHIQLFSEFA